MEYRIPDMDRPGHDYLCVIEQSRGQYRCVIVERFIARHVGTRKRISQIFPTMDYTESLQDCWGQQTLMLLINPNLIRITKVCLPDYFYVFGATEEGVTIEDLLYS